MIDPGMLAAVIANPKDDLCRLIYADWLDERGDPRGEFVRVQCELARDFPGLQKRCTCQSSIDKFHCDRCLDEEQSAPLRARERELLDAYSEKHWSPPTFCSIQVGGPRRWVEPLRIVNKATTSRESRNRQDVIMEWVYTRGFVSHITCTAEDWFLHSDAILAATPLEAVTLTTPAIVAKDGPGMLEIRRMDANKLRQIWPSLTFSFAGREGG